MQGVQGEAQGSVVQPMLGLPEIFKRGTHQNVFFR